MTEQQYVDYYSVPLGLSEEKAECLAERSADAVASGETAQDEATAKFYEWLDRVQHLARGAAAERHRGHRLVRHRLMPEPEARHLCRASPGSSPSSWSIGLATFAMTRDEDTPPPPVVTTTTFPREGYIDAISAALTKEVRVSLGATAPGASPARWSTSSAPTRLEALAEEAAPLAALTASQRERMLRIVVTCVDPLVAEALLGSGREHHRRVRWACPTKAPDRGVSGPVHSGRATLGAGGDALGGVVGATR